MAKNPTETITLKLTLPSLNKLLEYFKDLTRIDDKVFLKIDGKNILIYSMVGDHNQIHAFKSHTISFNNIFDGKFIDTSLTMIIGSTGKDKKGEGAKKIARNLAIFEGINEDLEFKITYNSDGYIEKLTIKNKKLKIDIPGGDPISNKLDINVDDIKEYMNVDNSMFSFSLNKDDFDRIKKMSTIDLNNDIIYLNIKDKVITLSEMKWELNVAEIDYEDTTISFPKKYFNSIIYNSEEKIIYVFDTFILVLDDLSNLMISIELTI
jgi:hypothetical protein